MLCGSLHDTAVYSEIDSNHFRKLSESPVRSMTDERQLKVLRLLEGNPDMTQRQLAETLGVSVGATNYCLKALVGKGWVKLENFQRNPNKLGYLYLLTPRGVAAKAQLTASFLRYKLKEYESLKAEIEDLKSEIDSTVD